MVMDQWSFQKVILQYQGAGNEEDYVEHLVNAIQGKELNKASKNETYYYLRKGRVKQ